MLGKKTVATAALAAAVWGTVASRTWAATPLPTDDEVQKLVDAKDYKGAEEQLNRLIACKGKAAEHNDRFRDLMLLNECYLQEKKEALLEKTLKAAIDYAEQQHDLDGLGQAASLELARRASRDLVYSPAADRKAKYDLTDPVKRAAAAPLVYKEALAGIKEQWRTAKGGRDLGPVVEVAARFALVRGMEHAVTGQTVDTDKLGAEIEKTAATMIQQKLAADAKQVDNARKTAMQMVDRKVINANGVWVKARVRRGLSAEDIKALKDMQAWCGGLGGQIDAMNQGLADPLQLDASGPSADDVRQKISDLLTDLDAQ